MDSQIDMNIIGLIPSRLCSKRLPGKAIANIAGLPLIVHTAKRAMMSKLLSNVIVCTDSVEIASKCKKYKLRKNIYCVY